MKNKILLLSLGLTLSHFAFSQCNNSGIGTLQPNAKLEVRGCSNDSTTAAFKVTNSTDTTTTPILFLRNDKRVGIGTKYPTEKLSVVGNATFSGSITAGSIKGTGNAPATFDSLKISGLSGSGNRNIYVDANGNLRVIAPLTSLESWDITGNILTGTLPHSPTEWFGTQNNADIIFKTDATEKMRITASGNVGIGTDDPQHQLQLYTNDPPPPGGDAERLLPIDTTLNFDSLGNYISLPIQNDPTFRTLQISNNTTTKAGDHGLILGVSGTAGFLELQEANQMAIRSKGGVSLFTTSGNAFVGTLFGAMILQSKGTMRLRVNGQWAIVIPANGNVGIGCTNPQYRLDVGGTARAKEFRVSLSGCDFVFEKNYNLITLNQRKIKVLAEKHLPNIAPAFDMQQGTDLGLFSLGLLQNLEEHENYLYQHNDRIDVLEKENTELKTKMEKQEQEMEAFKKEIENLKKKISK